MPLPSLVGSLKMYLLGDVFLRNFYSVYDFEQQSVKLGVNQHSKDHASIQKRDPAWQNMLIYLSLMSITCLLLFIAFHKITSRIKFEMLESLDDQKIADERAYLIAIASASQSHSSSSRDYKYSHGMSAIAEEKTMSEEEDQRIIHEQSDEDDDSIYERRKI